MFPLIRRRQKKTVWNQFTTFCTEREYTLSAETSEAQLANIMKDYAYNMKKMDGEDYKEVSIFLCVAKTTLLAALVYFVLYYPLGDPFLECKSFSSSSCQECSTLCCLYWMTIRAAYNTIETVKIVMRKSLDILYDCKLRLYILLETLDHDDFCAVCRISASAASTYLLDAKVAKRSQVDKILENEITYKLADDLLQSIEKKFNVDLERSLDMLMTKIHLLLQSGTQNTLDRFTELQASLDDMKVKAPAKLDNCLQQKDNQSTSLTEKALHQMVVCGYALIGQDPVLAINKIHTLKNMIRDEVKPMNAQKKGIYELLRVCGHEHDSLRKVVKCVISKSPTLKSVMMSVTGKLIDGIVELTKMLAHGAMHEACLIEVLKSAEDEASEILAEVKTCVHNDNSLRLNEDYSLVEKLKEDDLNTLKVNDENGIERNDVDLKSKSNIIEDVRNVLNSTA